MQEGRLKRRAGRRPLVSLSIGLLVSLLVVLAVLALHTLFTGPHPGANDFYIPWRATRALVVEGRNPYAPEVTRDIQQALFGGPRPPGTHQFAFAYPLTVLPLLAPFAPLPYDWAEAIWLTLLLGALLGGLFLTLRTVRWSPHPLVLAGLALWAILFYPAARALILGQIAVVVFLLVTLSLFLLHRGHLAWAGLTLAATTIKPQMVIFFLPALLLWGVNQKHWAMLRSFGLTLFGMIALPLLWLPTWPGEFAHAVTDYAGYVPVGSPVEVALARLPFNRGSTVVVNVLLLVLLAHQLWQERTGAEPNLLWIASLSIVVGLLIMPRGGTTNQVLLIIPCTLVAYWLTQRNRGPIVASILLTILTLAPWILFLITVQGNTAQDIMFVPLPFAVLLLLLFRPGKQSCVR